MESNTNDELAESKNLPWWFKVLVSVITIPVILVVFYLYWLYIFNPDSYQSPKELGLPIILMFSVSLLVFAFIPWEQVRLIFKKIGPFELQEMLNTQANERDKELSEIDERLTTLEDKVFTGDETSFITKSFYGPKLRQLLVKFLSEYEPTAYSPTKIKKWAAKQKGYEEFSKFELPHIRLVLRELVSEGILTTVVSRKGNTLYKIIS